jgi:hypothetical protein
MRSLWLDWPNSRGIIENARHGEVSKLTKTSFGGSVSWPSPSIAIRRIRNIEFPVKDPYAERMRAALRQIASPGYPQGMILWLETAHPGLYAELMTHIPDEISRIWNERAALESFESILARLISLHRQCCDVYLAARNESRDVPKTSQFNFGTLSADGDTK